MEHNKAVLTSQEHAMKEYLRRQQIEAEKHIRHYSPGPARRGLPPEPSASMPGTPLNVRRSNGEAEAAQRRLQEVRLPNSPSLLHPSLQHWKL